jgi:hypothetical protein
MLKHHSNATEAEHAAERHLFPTSYRGVVVSGGKESFVEIVDAPIAQTAFAGCAETGIEFCAEWSRLSNNLR